MVVTENLLSLHLSCPSVSVIENFKVQSPYLSQWQKAVGWQVFTCPSISQYPNISQNITNTVWSDTYRYLYGKWSDNCCPSVCSGRGQIFPSISQYSQSILRILPSDILGMFQMGCLTLRSLASPIPTGSPGRSIPASRPKGATVEIQFSDDLALHSLSMVAGSPKGDGQAGQDSWLTVGPVHMAGVPSELRVWSS